MTHPATTNRVRTLVLMHTESNAGYAIAPLEAMFLDVACELGQTTPDCVHFAYKSLRLGAPTNLPTGVPCLAFDTASSPSEHAQLAEYVRQHRITLVLAFDLQPVHPLYRVLRSAGVECIVSYWGAEISARKPFFIRVLKRLQILLSRSRLDGLVFESQAMADLARYGRGIPEHMIDVVPLGIDLTRFSAERSDYVYSQFPIPRNHKIVVYAGHMEERKGVESLISAAKILLLDRRRHDMSFLLFGDRQGERDRFVAMYEGTELETLVHFGGYRNDLHRCFSGCFAGVIPSTGWDSFPRTAIELAASGLPLLVSRLGGLPETIVDGETGLLFEPGDAHMLANHLEKLAQDPALASRMGAAGRKRCEDDFTLQVQRRRLRAALARRTMQSSP